MARVTERETATPIVRRLRTIAIRSVIGPGRRCVTDLSARRGPIIAVLFGLLVVTASGTVALGKDVEVETDGTETGDDTETAHVVTSTLSVSLTDKTGTPLANQEVSIVDKWTNQLVYQGNTDDNGRLSVQLPNGQYNVIIGDQLKSVNLNKDRDADFRTENQQAPEDDENESDGNDEDDDGDGAVDEDDEDDTDGADGDDVDNDGDGAVDEDDESGAGTVLTET